MSAKTILVLDDEVHILELISYNLDNAVYKVIKAETGEKALELLKQHEIDLAILDIMLQGLIWN